jgi:hypothetical protein
MLLIAPVTALGVAGPEPPAQAPAQSVLVSTVTVTVEDFECGPR